MAKPVYEEVLPEFGSSFKVLKFDWDDFCNQSKWHFHPEYEIVYISNGNGKRYIGDHIFNFENGTLTFLGPNIPHLGFATGLKDPHLEVVVQMKPGFLGGDFFDRPELEPIQNLFKLAEKGLSFGKEVQQKIGPRLAELANRPHFERLINLLLILEELAKTEDYDVLNVNGLAIDVTPNGLERLSRVYDYVANHFKESIVLEDVANTINMTVPSFCRYFKKITNKTFTQFVNEYRVRHACRLLNGTDDIIANIGFECGFNNLSHFNHQFKNITGMSPSDFRNRHHQILHIED